MKKLLVSLVSLFLCFTSFAAGRLVADSLESRILGTTVKCNVYLPEGFDKSADHYPVIYLLHGLTDTWEGWQQRGHMKGVADELMASGESAAAVIIMPNAGHPNPVEVWNGYFNMPGWNYEDFFFQELMPTLEARYRCGGSKGQRAVMGLSMGGGGSVVYSQRHPDCFSSCYSMSGWLDNKFAEVGNADGKQDKFTILCAAVRDHSALDFMDNASQETVDALKTVAWFIDCGDDDFLLKLSVDLYYKMRARGVRAEFRVRNGAHTWEYWHQALRLALPFASRNFSR